jgi:hypothetical protein
LLNSFPFCPRSDDEAAFTFQVKLGADSKSISLAPYPATIPAADGTVLASWDTLTGSGSEASNSFTVDSDSWRTCNLTQVCASALKPLAIFSAVKMRTCLDL